MSDIRKKIVDFFNSLATREKLILLFVLVVVLVVFYVLVIDNNYRGTDINYKDLSAEKIIEYSSIVYDRDQILALDEVVDKILKINDGTWVLDNEPITIKDIYSQVVTPNYKKKMSSSKFKNTFEDIYKKVLGENGKYNSSNNYIDTIYHSAEHNMYLVKLNTITEEESAYIGIRIDNNDFLITYAE